MSCARDLTLDEALSDPVIGAAMRADHVDPGHFETLLRATAGRLGAGSRPAASTTAVIASRASCGTSDGSARAW